MKKFILLSIALVAATAAIAQKKSVTDNYKLLNVGIGLNSFYDSGIPFGASFEVGVAENISAGVNFDYLSSTYRGFGIKYTFTALYFGARGSYHFNDLLQINADEWDIYGGLTIGYRSFSWKDDFNNNGLGNSYGSGLYAGIYAGARYAFNDKIGAFTELGAIGSTNFRLGASFKF